MPQEPQSTDEQLVRVIDKGPAGQIHIRLSRFRERDYLDIRNFYMTEAGEWRPTRKGIAIPVEFYDELMDALAAAKPMIEARIKAGEA